jgi:hypothetical protein
MRHRLRTLLTRALEAILVVAIIAVCAYMLVTSAEQAAESQRRDAARDAASQQ